MIEKIVRSPFMQIVCVWILFIWFYVLAKPIPVEVPFVIFMLVFFLLLTALIMIHNQRHPKRKIRLFTFTPYELQEDDEGQQWVTNRASRKVYIMYWAGIPISAGTMISFPYFPEVPLGLLLILATIQYSIMWIETKRYLN
ncbi:hypothetical protein [Alkalicoccobacillus plakortidis]|uniref:Uncharacterized protein n=1 Tax=Alkalicoccobacillus plakortidis TaxID=444060 RepID=A0ABT0XJ41_9BACI|nr:hypothetical protein [Alkalicoccobacillus plakortidis]MCM2675765.1 hypothetical protein [Alkalicoccobacillus plakortidis]